MTLVEQPVGELVGMGVDEAREITNDIKRTGSVMWSQITKAFQGRAWAALGYESWDAYCDAEFDGARLKLPREERTMVVASLADAGMSTRAIAAATGVSKNTITSDLRQVSQIGTPDGNRHPIRFDGHRPAAGLNPSPALASTYDDEIVDAEVIDDPTPEPRTVTGTDGKSYTLKPKPTADRRPPLTDAANSAGMKLRNRVELLEAMFADDRFQTHQDALAPMLRSHLTYAIEACERMLAEINN